jgi:Mrp family chromosome partitioning ATPase
VGGLASFVFCVLILFILFYLDESMSSPQELADKTGIRVLGYVPLLLDLSVLDFDQFWSNKSISDSATEYKNQLRSARFEIDNIIHSPKLLNITSLKESEGKTLFAICLASAYLMISKKVLLIDGNFAHSSITEYLKPEYYLEDYLQGVTEMPAPTYHNDFVVMGNRGNDISLFEITDEATIRQKIEALKQEFDVIFIESSSLDTLNKSKEWNTVTDHVLSVYEADLAMSPADKLNLGYLRSLNDQFIGWILNRVTVPPVTAKKRKRTK